MWVVGSGGGGMILELVNDDDDRPVLFLNSPLPSVGLPGVRGT